MKLLAPLRYLSIRHDEKRRYDLWYPLAGATVLTLIYALLEVPFSLLGKSGLVPQVNGLLQVLIGFYIAALAAISTFSSATIDEKMAGTPPVIKEMYRGNLINVPLARRRFLCFLFGYLALVSFVVFACGVLASLFTKPAVDFITGIPVNYALPTLKVIFLFCYSFVLFNLTTTTLLGLYYLSVRIHQPND
ncbi:hypothetical protein AB6T85_01040 [Erwinia sp. ACCC 02193]|uniref:DUF805 domain-containing protein n=1 Tax=Erwinia aeris TaxID=3239803 RepID=A0ABV4E2A3_9GAMM